MISNAAFRVDDELDPGELLERAQAFFAPRERGFALWARAETRRGSRPDRRRQGGRAARRSTRCRRWCSTGEPEEHPLPDGVELRRVVSASDAADYWRVATGAYASIGFPPEIFAFYEDHDGLSADNAATFIADLDGRPAGIAMTIVSHGVAGIYWVGTSDEARGRGLGWTVTAAAVNAGFDLGAEIASLQASPMGESLYLRMGFETIFRLPAAHVHATWSKPEAALNQIRRANRP